MENHPGGAYIPLSKRTQTFKIHRRAGKERMRMQGWRVNLSLIDGYFTPQFQKKTSLLKSLMYIEL